MISADTLRRFNARLQPGTAAIYAVAIDAVLQDAEISSNHRRIRHFMAQLAHESAGFSGLTESLNYRDPQHLLDTFSAVQTLAHARQLIADGPEAIGNCVYANKLGNGSAASGDGYRFRGRGFIMNTGRANYATVQRAIGVDLVTHPDLLGSPKTAARAAAVFWKDRAINLAADADDVVAVTRLVNGNKLQGLDDRRARLAIAAAIWPD